VLELKQSGVGAIAGPGLVTDLAEREGLRGVFLYSRTSVGTAFETALEVARGGRVEAHKRARLDLVFSHLRDGIAVLGPTGLVESINPRMAQICSVDMVGAQGKPLRELVPEFAPDVLDAAHEETELVQIIGRKSYVVQRIALHERGAPTGWVLSVQEAQALQRIDRSLRSRHKPTHLIARYRLEDLLGAAEPMRRLREVALRYAGSDATVLISGESGTGKELVAQGMHNRSARQGFPFVAVNCGAFPEALLESELFGYEEGAFTGARRGGKPGLIESAHGGTLFLDEIAEMPALLQTRLLRVLQEREVVRLGATQPTPVDIRVMAATHRNLDQLLEQGSLREDLYYRLNILRIAVPALRERLADLPDLLSGLLARATARLGVVLPIAALAEAMLPFCARYDWPGNVRELENIVERIVIFYVAADDATQVVLGPVLREVAPELFSRAGATPTDGSLKAAGRSRERTTIRAMLAQCGGDQQEVCRRLGISRSTLWRRLREQS
jgi:propionate catabolism operon transcriptional regulator